MVLVLVWGFWGVNFGLGFLVFFQAVGFFGLVFVVALVVFLYHA